MHFTYTFVRQDFTTTSSEEPEDDDHVKIDDITQHIRHSAGVRKQAAAASTKTAVLQTKRYETCHPPSIYNVGELMMVRLHRSISRSSWMRKSVTPVTTTGKIAAADRKHHKYLVRCSIQDEELCKWFSVGDITFLTSEEGNVRQAIAKAERSIQLVKLSKV